MTDGKPNPSFQIENSKDITDEATQRKVLEYIMQSEFYSQKVYQRTIDSMIIEWQAHNELYTVSRHSRLKSTDFDKNSEKMTKWDYYIYAFTEALK